MVKPAKSLLQKLFIHSNYKDKLFTKRFYCIEPLFLVMNFIKYLSLTIALTISLFADVSCEEIEKRLVSLETQLAQLINKLSIQEHNMDAESKQNIVVNDENTLFERFSQKMYQKEEDKLFPWLNLNKWESVQLGMDEKEVLEILGKPTLDELSLNKRIDNVFTYKGRVLSTNKKVEGKVRFYKGKVIDILVPQKD